MSESTRVIAKRYELTKLVGSGGMAEVYAANDTVLNRKVAIKLLNRELAANKKFAQRFKQEAKAAAAMAHPNIVRVLDAGESIEIDTDGQKYTQSYLVMEYVDGLPLSKLVNRGALKVPEALRVTREILSAVEFAHNAGIIHRDIKPDNIMIARNGKVKIVDFGIARAVAETFDDLATTTSILGTAAYFSPEQAQGQKVDVRTDLYAVGIVLFEMLTGKIPFSGDTAVAVAHQHIHAQPPAPSSLNPKVSPLLDQVVFKALAKDKSDRYQTTSEFGREIREAENGTLPVTVVAAPEAPADDFQELLGATISEPALEKSASPSELPEDFLFLFGDDPQTAPTLVQPEQYRPEPKRVVAIVGVVALVFGAIAGMGLWVATLKPVNLFPSTSISVPVLKGESYSAAEKELKDLGLSPVKVLENSGLVTKGKVIRTEPGKDAKVEIGAVIQVFVSDGKAMVAVPDLTGTTLADAKAAITAAGFIVGTITETTSPSVGAGLVISTTPIVATELFQGEKVDISVSNGKVDLPDLRGKSVKDANGILSSLMLQPTVQADTGCTKSPEPTVKTQSVSPGLIPQGTAVTISYCSG